MESRGKRCFGKVVINRPVEEPPGKAGGGGVARVKPPDPEPGGGATSPPDRGEDIVPRIKSTGTAFVVNRQGNLVTNNHVVDDCGMIGIASDGRVYRAFVVATDPLNDLAVISAADLPLRKVARFRSAGPRLGEDLMAAGFPYSTILGTSLKTTFGNVSSVVGGTNVAEFQLSASIQPGNSGGPIVDQSGVVIGVVTSKLSDDYMLKSRGQIAQLINFGVRSEVALVFLKAHRIPITTVGAGKAMSNADLAAQALEYTFLLVCA
jgi:S1-C subfamily serine protease